MTLDKTDHQLPGMVDNSSGQTDKGKADRFHSLREPPLAESESLHGGMEIEGQNCYPPPGRILPEVPRGESAPEEIVLEDGMGLFTFAAAFIGKGNQLLSLQGHVRAEGMDLVLYTVGGHCRERKVDTGEDRLMKHLPDSDVAVGLPLLGIRQLVRHEAYLCPFPVIESFPFR